MGTPPTPEQPAAQPLVPYLLGRRDRGPFDGTPEETETAKTYTASALDAELDAAIQRRITAKILVRPVPIQPTPAKPEDPSAEQPKEVQSNAAPDAGSAIPKLTPKQAEEARTQDENVRTSLAGLALSGGGIRSATFSLGALQALADKNHLKAFDYLSTVSGGGFTGGWWSAWLSRPGRKDSDGIFPRSERLEPDRYPPTLLTDESKTASLLPEGSRSVTRQDPIHHLRLFSNYLIPRRGLLSADTWRAATIITRNIILSWLVLIPLLLATVLVGQLYVAGRHDSSYAFVCRRPDFVRTFADSKIEWRELRRDTTAVCRGALAAAHSIVRRDSTARADGTGDTSSVDVLRAANATLHADTLTHAEILVERAKRLADPAIVGLAFYVLLTVLWILYGSGKAWLTGIGFVALVAAGGLLIVIGDGPKTSFAELSDQFKNSRWMWFALAAAIGVVVVLGLGPWIRERRRTSKQDVSSDAPRGVSRDQARNAIVRWQSRLVMTFTLLLVVLVLFGFGHEVGWYLFQSESGVVPAAAKRAGGWLGLAVASLSAILAVAKSFPSPKGKDAAAERPSAFTTFVLATAPLLTVLALILASTSLTHWILTNQTEWAAGGYPVDSAAAYALMIGAGLMFVLAGMEAYHYAPKLRVPEDMAPRVVAILGVLAVLFALYATKHFQGWRTVLASLTDADNLIVFSSVVLALRIADSFKLLDNKRVMIVGSAVAAFVVHWFLADFLRATPTEASYMFTAARWGLGALAVFLLADWIARSHVSARVTALGGIALLECAVLVLLYYFPHDLAATAVETTALGWTGFLLAWVVGFGWMIDPNLVSLHNFYKARLVRAYLGASNVQERVTQEITDAAPHDDLPLAKVANHTLGAPLHLVGTTLNLVGARDLATAQRNAAFFTLSSQVCGSARTGYRPTSDYMDGKLSLGTAIAASGAAVSPTMGTKPTSAPLALLLALFDVRLGYWAPTPNQRRWRESQPRLWPYYLLTEALSQTTDVGTYCYLTDGGHFDNTGVYPLVERGCRYVVVLDDGADPNPCFSDMGDLIRRCRIDFGAEIAFSDTVDDIFIRNDKGMAKAHYVEGKIAYAEQHLRMLGWRPEDINKHGTVGKILWIKPSLTPTVPVDIRQYSLENKFFPQQTTADQFYDESQFESYRALGYRIMQQRSDEIAGLRPELQTQPHNPERLFKDILTVTSPA